MSDPYIVYGMEASYFTQKVLGLLAYKEIPTDFRKKDLHVRKEVEEKSGTHLMPVVVTPEGEWLWDSTPIAFELDRRYPESAIVPEAALGMAMARILEDFFDEWPTRQALHFRWHYPENLEVAGSSLARDAAGIPQEAPLDDDGATLLRNMRATIEAWARKTALSIGAGPGARDEMEGEWSRLVTLLDRHFEVHDFLLGSRPSLPDFALYGGLAAHFLFDPGARALTLAHAPGLGDYRDRVARARASQCGDWPAFETVPETLAPILQHVALGFHRFLVANRTTLAAGAETVELDLGYGTRRTRPRRYTEKTRRSTAEALAGLDDDQRAEVEAALGPLGVIEAYSA